MTRTAACKLPIINEGKFNTACRVVEQARDGLVHVLLTGKGEPMLWPDMITAYLELLNFRFPIIELQTNGTLIQQAIDSGEMARWQDLGLTRVCISMTHLDSHMSNKLMGIKDREYSYWYAAQLLRKNGLSVRLNLTMLRSGISDSPEIDELIRWCKVDQIDQLTIREVDTPDETIDPTVYRYTQQEKPIGAANRLHHWLMAAGAHKLLVLPHGGVVFDYGGQNVCISNCITSTTNPDDIRQLIFFPDGRLMYDWKYEGARLL